MFHNTMPVIKMKNPAAAKKNNTAAAIITNRMRYRLWPISVPPEVRNFTFFYKNTGNPLSQSGGAGTNRLFSKENGPAPSLTGGLCPYLLREIQDTVWIFSTRCRAFPSKDVTLSTA
jgi:hypothetical protein